ncbi:SapC family protein [Aliikangiella coralliicola]|uniref:SapC family protein n=1 Tax=Aliikangiella coralliicola TaxID=2592383 RepID=A0A545UHH3_9GAMM|nr:SapC family protein [Aliikangiella coralliicola]TQV88924.1 SapC family protein [Aliikangiella coralliicola]
MQENIVQLDKVEHSDIKLKNSLDLKRAGSGNMSPVIVHEIPQLSTQFPLIFIKNSNTGEFNWVALFGLESKQNLFVENEKWTGKEIPAIMTHVPLGMTTLPEDNDKLLVVIDTLSHLVSKDEGEALFNENGDETEFLKKRIQAMLTYQHHAKVTKELIQLIVELDLLESKEFSFEIGGDKKNLGGMYLISEEKLNKLPDEKILLLQKKGVLGAIYHHFSSLHNFKSLLNRLSERQGAA